MTNSDWKKPLIGAVQRILEIQSEDGAIPWVEESVFDPWNHTECAMALDAMGETDAATRAYDHLLNTQNMDGSWWAGYGNAVPLEDDLTFIRGERGAQVRDTNFSAYPAIGIWRRAIQFGAEAAAPYFPMVQAGIDFAISLQSEFGDICWSAEGWGSNVEDSLLTGNASIHMSLACMIGLARMFKTDTAPYETAKRKLTNALANHPERFDRRQQNGARYAMDWYYPSFSNALTDIAARTRINARWDDFVEHGVGCRCVVDSPWITIAESAELAMTCLKLGWHTRAKALLNWQLKHRDKHGAFWMGYQFETDGYWPGERPSWTQGAMILAMEAVYAKNNGTNILMFTAPITK